MVSRLDGVPVELGFDFGAISCDEVVATAFLFVFGVFPVHYFSEVALVTGFVADEVENGCHSLNYKSKYNYFCSKMKQMLF